MVENDAHSPSAQLIAALDEILFQIGKIDHAIDEARNLDPIDRRAVKRIAGRLHREAARLFTWVTARRLEDPEQ